jgi:hypothetical protein
MWNPFRKLQQNQEQMFQQMMQAMMAKADEQEKPYRSTKIGFGANFNVGE